MLNLNCEKKFVIFSASVLQALFNFNYMFLLLMGTITAHYLLPTEYNFLITLPIVTLLIGNFIVMPISQKIMMNYGHRTGFFLAIFGNIFSSYLAYKGILDKNLSLFLASMFGFGLSHGFSTYIKFSIADQEPCCKKVNALSVIVLGGVISTLFLPIFIQYTQALFLPSLYLGSFFSLMILNILGLILPIFIKNPDTSNEKPLKSISFKTLFGQSNFVSAFSAGLASHSTMTILMVMMPIIAIGCGFSQTDTSYIMQLHFVTMLAPLIITPWLLKKLSLETSVLTGLSSLIISCMLFSYGATYQNEMLFQLASIFLGFGWGHTSISAGGFLMKCYCDCDATGVQSSNELFITLFTTVLILISGILYHFFGIVGILGLCLTFISLAILTIAYDLKLKHDFAV